MTVSPSCANWMLTAGQKNALQELDVLPRFEVEVHCRFPLICELKRGSLLPFSEVELRTANQTLETLIKEEVNRFTTQMYKTKAEVFVCGDEKSTKEEGNKALELKLGV